MPMAHTVSYSSTVGVSFRQGCQDTHLQCRLQLVHEMLLLSSSLFSITCRKFCRVTDPYKLKIEVFSLVSSMA